MTSHVNRKRPGSPIVATEPPAKQAQVDQKTGSSFLGTHSVDAKYSSSEHIEHMGRDVPPRQQLLFSIPEKYQARTVRIFQPTTGALLRINPQQPPIKPQPDAPVYKKGNPNPTLRAIFDRENHPIHRCHSPEVIQSMLDQGRLGGFSVINTFNALLPDKIKAETSDEAFQIWRRNIHNFTVYINKTFGIDYQSYKEAMNAINNFIKHIKKNHFMLMNIENLSAELDILFNKLTINFMLDDKTCLRIKILHTIAFIVLEKLIAERKKTSHAP